MSEREKEEEEEEEEEELLAVSVEECFLTATLNGSWVSCTENGRGANLWILRHKQHLNQRVVVRCGASNRCLVNSAVDESWELRGTATQLMWNCFSQPPGAAGLEATGVGLTFADPTHKAKLESSLRVSMNAVGTAAWRVEAPSHVHNSDHLARMQSQAQFTELFELTRASVLDAKARADDDAESILVQCQEALEAARDEAARNRPQQVAETDQHRTYPNGTSYQGQMVDGKREGHGVYIDTKKNRYEGGWLNDESHGFASKVFTKGDFESVSNDMHHNQAEHNPKR